MDWFTTTLTWYFYLLFLGIIFTPLAKKLFGSFFDGGYAFAKTLGIIVLSYTMFVLGILKLIPFTRESLFFILILFAILFYSKLNNFRFSEFKKSSKKLWLIIGIEELLFLSSLLLLAFIRGMEPSIHGLEKFMDYGFIKSILRSEYFPPLDMWYSADPTKPEGYPINYYYFGHLTGALLIKLTNIPSAIGYNLILATILAQGVILAFSICGQLVYLFQKFALKIKQPHVLIIIMFGLLGTFLVNFAGNLQTIYLFTTGYPNESPIPFWQIWQNWDMISETLKSYEATNQDKGLLDALIQNSKYWYPNATRFIPFTIHEFPSYSYVVADLHGHVFDIPFVLVTLGLITQFFVQTINRQSEEHKNKTKHEQENTFYSRLLKKVDHSFKHTPIIRSLLHQILDVKSATTLLLGFMIAVHYMTNAFDGPIYLLLIGGIYLLIYQLRPMLFIQGALLVLSFIVFSYPFSTNFAPFVSGIGVNCSPDFLVNIKQLGPFLFEKGNCQISQLWMLFILWGFFWLCAVLYLIVLFVPQKKTTNDQHISHVDVLMLIFFAFGTFLVIIPEFFYIKDIYPAHFRANTMFKMGYQAFIIMSIASAFVLYRISTWHSNIKYILKSIYFIFFLCIFIYPFIAFPSYYSALNNDVIPTPQLDGSKWIESTPNIAQDKEIIDYINTYITGQPVILEAQGDSYTDYERISAYTGTPTIAGWWVHEWLWRGSADVVGKRIPDIQNIYESTNIEQTQELLRKYNVQYVVISKLEKEKYPKLNEAKFDQIGNKIFTTKNGSGALYKVN